MSFVLLKYVYLFWHGFRITVQLQKKAYFTELGNTIMIPHCFNGYAFFCLSVDKALFNLFLSISFLDKSFISK